MVYFFALHILHARSLPFQINYYNYYYRYHYHVSFTNVKLGSINTISSKDKLWLLPTRFLTMLYSW